MRANKFCLLEGMSLSHGDFEVKSLTEMYWAHGKILVPLKPFELQFKFGPAATCCN